MDRTKTYYVWAGIKQRCRNPKNAMYASYGGRGIDVCDRWYESFEAFFEYMGEAPKGTSIDRIDNDGDYEPGNCRWTTPKQQGRNKRNNRMITANGECRSLSEWAEVTGIPKTTILSRLNHGWAEQNALLKSKPSSGQNPVPDVN